jgi:hypothetical protein
MNPAATTAIPKPSSLLKNAQFRAFFNRLLGTDFIPKGRPAFSPGGNYLAMLLRGPGPACGPAGCAAAASGMAQQALNNRSPRQSSRLKNESPVGSR